MSQGEGGGRPRVYTSADQLQQDIDGYFARLETTAREIVDNKGRVQIIKQPAYWTRLLLQVGLDRTTAVPYIEGVYDDEVNKYSAVLARARQLCECETAEGAMSGVYNERMSSLVLSVHHGMAERQEIVHSMAQLDSQSPPMMIEDMARLEARKTAQITGQSEDDLYLKYLDHFRSKYQFKSPERAVIAASYRVIEQDP
jgi:hypothetical protein